MIPVGHFCAKVFIGHRPLARSDSTLTFRRKNLVAVLKHQTAAIPLGNYINKLVSPNRESTDPLSQNFITMCSTIKANTM